MFPEGNLECQFQTFQNFMEVFKENALSLIKTSDFWKDDLKQAVVILQNSREI